MPFAIPLVGKIIADLASSATSASSAATQKTDTDTASTSSKIDFNQTVDDVSRAGASVAPQNIHPGRA